MRLEGARVVWLQPLTTSVYAECDLYNTRSQTALELQKLYLYTDDSHSDQVMTGTYVGADDSTSSIHVHSKLKRRSCFQIGKHFQMIFLFRDPDLLFDKEHLLSKRCQAHTSER